LFTITLVIHIIVSVIMIIAVLFQVGKGASIGSTFGGAGSQTLFGSSGPQTFLGKITAVCAAVFMITSLFLTYLSAKQRTSSIMSDVPAEVSVPPGSNQAPPGMPGAPSAEPLGQTAAPGAPAMPVQK
jgi:preprotein translocase subunit SecG